MEKSDILKYVGRGVAVVGLALLPACDVRGETTPRTEVQKGSAGDINSILIVKHYNPDYVLAQLSKNIIRVSRYENFDLVEGLNAVNNRCKIVGFSVDSFGTSSGSISYYILTEEDNCLNNFVGETESTPTGR